MNLLEVSGLTKRQGSTLAVNKVSFTQKPLQKIAIAGETGSGKSTLLKMIAGLIQPDEGEVIFENERVLGPEEKLLPGHPAIGYLSQHFELRNNYRVEEILSMSLKLSEEEAEVIYEVCRINHLLKRRTDQLSGGEKQRIATARLLISTPKLILLDEPFSNLDMVHKSILKEVIRDIVERLNITCILISHDPVDLLSWADEIIVMKDAEIIQQGSPLQIYRQPGNEYTAALFGKYNLLSPSLLQAYSDQSGIKLNEGNTFIRPENFKLVTSEKEALRGVVQEVNFLGNTFEVMIQVKEEMITLKTEKENIVKGDIVFVALSNIQ